MREIITKLPNPAPRFPKYHFSPLLALSRRIVFLIRIAALLAILAIWLCR